MDKKRLLNAFTYSPATRLKTLSIKLNLSLTTFLKYYINFDLFLW